MKIHWDKCWTHSGAVMFVVNIYKYQGLLFSTKLSFTAACQERKVYFYHINIENK